MFGKDLLQVGLVLALADDLGEEGNAQRLELSDHIIDVLFAAFVIAVQDLVSQVVHAPAIVAHEAFGRHGQPFEGIDEGGRVVGREDLRRRGLLVFNTGVAGDIGGGIHVVDVVCAPEVVVRHGQEFEDGVLTLAGEDPARHVVGPEDEPPEIGLLGALIGLCQTLCFGRGQFQALTGPQRVGVV